VRMSTPNEYLREAILRLTHLRDTNVDDGTAHIGKIASLDTARYRRQVRTVREPGTTGYTAVVSSL
jgi:hypothetical protein